MVSTRARVLKFGWLSSLTLALACSDRLADGVTGTGIADESGSASSADEIGETSGPDGEGSGSVSATGDSTDTSADSTADTSADTSADSTADTSADSTADTSADSMADTSATDSGSSDSGSSDTSATDSGSSDTSATDSGSSDSGSSDTGVDGCVGACGSPGCGACPDGEFIDFGDFAIGATEVTIGQYSDFLAVDFGLSGLPDTCSWKASFTPDSWVSQMQKNPALPVTSVDWCDASAYCTWAGGHLCGEVGGTPAALADFDDPVANEWFAACTDSGNLTWPYANAYDGAACNGVDAGIGATAPVGSLAGCEGGQPGVFDLSGNVWEWESGCADSAMTDDQTEECRYRGGSYFSGSNVLRCVIDAKRQRSYRNANTGIRCCS